MASNSLGDFDTPTSFRGRFEWALEDDSEERRSEPKVGSFRRQMRRHRSSRCLKIILMLALSMTLTQVFFYYTGTSVSTFDYKRTMPMAIVFESLGYDYNPHAEFQGEGEDYELLQEDLSQVGDTAEQQYDTAMAQAQGAEPVALHPDTRDQQAILYVPKERPLPSGPAAPAHALPAQPKEQELLRMVFEGNSHEESEHLEEEDYPEPNYPSFGQNLMQAALPPAQPAESPVQTLPGMPSIHDQAHEGFAQLGQVQSELVGNVQNSIANTEETNRKIEHILQSFQDKDHPVQSLNDEELLRLLTRPPSGEMDQSAEAHLLQVLEKFEADLQEKHEEPVHEDQQLVDQPAVTSPEPLAPTVIDREPDIPWETNDNVEDHLEQPADSPYSQALAQLVKTQNNPAEQAAILNTLKELIDHQMFENVVQHQSLPPAVPQFQNSAVPQPVLPQPVLPQQQAVPQPVMSYQPPAAQIQPVLVQPPPAPALPESVPAQIQVPAQQADPDYPVTDDAKLLHEDYVAEDMVEVAEQEDADARTAAALSVGSQFLYGYFPDGFMWSVATAAFQIEGGWNEGGKGKSIWDVFTHDGNVEDGSNAHVACDSYHRYIEDVMMLKQLGVKHYRFSISWSRIQPTGVELVPNRYGILYYNKLIDALLENGIQPVVTLYHWDLPQTLQEQGGWLNQTLIVKAFHNYAKICFTEFGDRVKFWITMNEPSMMAWAGYGRGKKAPGIHGESELVYIAGHNIIAAHATAYRMYQRDFQRKQKGFVGISLNIVWKESKTARLEDVAATERAMQFDLGWFAEPIYGSGDYPEVMKTQVSRKSMENGLPRSRLPAFTEAEKLRNKGTSDFFGVNSYTTRLVEHFPQPNKKPTYFKDQDVKYTVDPSWEMGPRGRAIYPEGIRKLVNWIQARYGQRPIYITENGISDESGALNDTVRVNYLKGYINSLLKAITIDGIRVVGYTVWTLMDNFEWERGYQEKLGLYQVDFHDPARGRTPRESARFYARLIAENGFPPPS